MIYGSVCSGIEAATAAWHVLGWSPAFFSEIEKFPSAVLAHHYPSVPNLGDMTKFEEWPDHAIDLLVGGTPCQSFSVAGLRQGLADPRGNLMLTYLAIARRYRPRWLVWENVPGVLSSNGGRDFGTFIRGLEECGYHAAWRVLDAQYVRVDGFPFAVPQRRRRVFVVGYLGDWRRAAAVLLERESLLGNPAPRRQAGEGVAGAIDAGAHPGSYSGQDAYQNKLIAFGGNNTSGPIDVATACQAHGGPHGRQDFGSETFIATRPVAATLTRGAESAGKGGYAGRRQEDDDNLVATPYTLAIRGRGDGHDLEYRQDGTANAILTPNGGRAGIGVGAICHDVRPINTMVGLRHEALGERTGLGIGGDGDPAFTLSKAHCHAVQHGWAVRRLTPRECERLQGFPDDFTAIPYRGKPAADGPRYKALGNSMAVNVMRWIGRRIEHVERIASEIERGAAA